MDVPSQQDQISQFMGENGRCGGKNVTMRQNANIYRKKWMFHRNKMKSHRGKSNVKVGWCHNFMGKMDVPSQWDEMCQRG